MTLKPFVSPHVHIQSLDSASTPAAFAQREVELGTGALVVSDHGTLVATRTVYELGKKHNLIPILGLEGYFRDDDCPIFKAAGIPKDKNDKYSDHFKYGHFTCAFRDQTAYETAIRLLSKAPTEKHGSEYKPLFPWSFMEELGATDTTVTSGCLIGIVARHLLKNNDPVMAVKYYERLRSLVRPGNFYVEAFPNVCTHKHVKGCFFTVRKEGAEPITLRFWPGKTLKTNDRELSAEDLAVEFGKKNNPHTHIVAVKNRNNWNDEYCELINADFKDGFVENECLDWCPDGDVQLGVNKFMIELANKYGDPILISDDAHHATPDEKLVQTVRLSQMGWGPFFGSYHRKSSEEAWAYFKDKAGINLKTFESWVDNSHQWRDSFKGFELKSEISIPIKFYESKYLEAGVNDSVGYVLKLIKQHGRMDWSDPVCVERLEQEIILLNRNGRVDLLGYFMVVEEVCRFYENNKRLTGVARGSAGGSMLAYLLGITHVNPIDHGLSLDRFLTRDRILSGKLPDIDTDLPSRDLLTGPDDNSGFLRERFGDHAAQISTINTLKLKNASRDVLRAKYGRVPSEAEMLIKNFLVAPQGLDDIKFVLGYEDSGNWIEGSIESDVNLIEFVKRYPKEWETIQKACGLGRSIARHASAFVIANKPIHFFVPTTMIKNVLCTQFTASAVEASGGLKYDFLVIHVLRDLSSCVNLIHSQHKGRIPEDGLIIKGKRVPAIRLVPVPGTNELADIWDLPVDQAVFADIALSNTETVFQLSTEGAQGWLKQFASKKKNGNYLIDSIEKISAFTALDRKGPLDYYVKTPDTENGRHNILVEYSRRLKGMSPSVDILPVFDKLFPETHGLMIFQEQTQRAYQELTGCSGSEAEEFRSDLAKKKKEKVMKAYPNFMEKATPRLGSKEQSQAVWEGLQAGAGYSFNKAHATAYAITAYACAYLKHHYSLSWWVSLLSNSNKEEINDKFWKYAGHLIKLPDLGNAVENFQIEGDKIQSPLSLLHGVGENAHAELIKGAPYTSIADLVKKIDDTKTSKNYINPKTGKAMAGRSTLHKGIIYKLIMSGAADGLFPPDMDDVSKLEAYESEVWKLKNVKKLASGKGKAIKSPDSIPDEYKELNQFTRYQIRKEILPAYSEPLLGMLLERKYFRVKSRGYEHIWNNTVTFVDGKTYTATDIKQKYAVAVYITDTRVFNWGPRKEKQACELMYDLDGVQLKSVKWGNKETGKLDSRFGTCLNGSIAVLVIEKNDKGGFYVDDVEVIQHKLEKQTEDKEESA